MRTLALLIALTRSSVILMRRYWFDTAAQLVTVYLIFLMIFLGYRANAGGQPGFGESVDGMVVGFMMFTFAVGAFSQLSNQVMQEALQGTLEQLAMSPLGLGRVMMCRLVGFTVINLVVVSVMLAVMMATTGRWLHLDLASVVPLLVLTALGIQGIGFALGGLAIVFKRVQSVFLVVQFILIGLIAVSIDRFPAVAYLPLSWGTRLLRQVMVDDHSLLDLAGGDMAFLALNSAAYFAVGFAIFKQMEHVARRRGLLGHY